MYNIYLLITSFTSRSDFEYTYVQLYIIKYHILAHHSIDSIIIPIP